MARKINGLSPRGCIVLTNQYNTDVTAGRTPRTDRGARTRLRVLEVTRRLLSESGPRSVTLDQVAARSEVAKTSILWHFGSKQELLLEALDEVIRDFEKAFSTRYPDPSTPAERLALFLRDYAAFMKQHPYLGDVFFSFAFSDRSDQAARSRVRDLYRRYRAMVASHIGAVSQDEGRELAAAIVGLVDGVFIQWSLDPDQLEPGAVFGAFLRGLTALGAAPAEGPAGASNDAPAQGGE
jgi:AcrR family transcriptional regulator